MSHPRKSLDGAIHAPVRFAITAALAAVDQADFRSVRETFVGERPRAHLSLTREGRRVLRRHVAALRGIAAGI